MCCKYKVALDTSWLDCILYLVRYLYDLAGSCRQNVFGLSMLCQPWTCAVIDLLLITAFVPMEHKPRLAHKVTPVISCWLHAIELF